MKKLLIAVLLSVLAATPLVARNRFQGYAERGGQTFLTALTGASMKGMATYQYTQYDVFNSGTSTPATIYSDITGTPKVCPCTTDSTGYLVFYGEASTYDLRISPGGAAAFTKAIYPTLSAAASTGAAVVDFGAKCDGVTDDTAAFVAAENSLTAGDFGGGTIIVPAGTCVVNGWTPTRYNVKLLGAGELATTLKGTTAGNFVIHLVVVSRWRIADMTIDGGGVKQSAITIGDTATAGTIVYDHIRFDGATQDTVRLGGVGQSFDVSFNDFYSCSFISPNASNSQIRIAGSNTAEDTFYSAFVAGYGSTVPFNVDFQNGEIIFYNSFFAGAAQYDFKVAVGNLKLIGGSSESLTGFFHTLASDTTGYQTQPMAIRDFIAAAPIYHEATRVLDLENVDTAANIRIGVNGKVRRNNVNFTTAATWVYDSATPRTRTAPMGRFILAGATQTINSGVETAVTFDSVTFNNGLTHSSSVNPSQVIIPAGQSGYYRVSGGAEWTGAPTLVETRFRVNGSATPTSRALGTNVPLTDIIWLADADSVEMTVTQSSGAPQNIVGGTRYGTYIVFEKVDG